VASSQDLAFVYAIAWTALNLLVNPYMAMFNLYSLGWGFSWLRFFSPFNYAWQVRFVCWHGLLRVCLQAVEELRQRQLDVCSHACQVQ
jgi:hypothetical protein